MIYVYVKINDKNYITDINSSIFLADTTGWAKIDEGEGDKYAHAQGNYLLKPIRDEYGRFNYCLNNGAVCEIPEEDKPPVSIPEPPAPSNAELAAAIAELAEVMFNG